MSIKLDLTKFKHLKSDENSTTLQHKDGHKLVIANKALHPESQAALKALSNISKQDATNLQQDSMKHQSDQKMANGGQPEPTAGRGSATVGGTYVPSRGGSSSTSGRSTGISGADITKPSTWFAEGGKVAKYCQYCGNGTHEGACDMLADGGKVADKPSPKPEKPVGTTLNYPDMRKEYIDKNKRKHYANGATDVQPDSPEAMMRGVPDLSDPAPIGVKPLPEKSPQDPDREDTKRYYDKLAGKPDLTEGTDVYMNPSKTFSKTNGQPENFSKDLWEQAKRDRDATLARQEKATQETTAAAGQDNQARADAGLPTAPILAPPSAMSPTMPQQNVTDSYSQSPQSSAQSGQPGQPGADPAAAPQGSGVDTSNPQSMFQSGVNQQMAGIRQGAVAQGNLGQAQSQILDNQVVNQQKVQQHFSDSYANLESERQNHMQDIKDGYINPDQYWTGDKDGNGSHSKIMTGIGMIMAGFNPTNSPNAAINFVKFQMEQNLKSQEKNLDSKNNLLAANLKQFGNLKDATEMTRLMQHDVVANQLQSAAANAASPVAAAAAQQAAGQLLQSAAPQAMTFAMQRAMMNIGNDPHSTGSQKEQQMDGMINMLRARDPSKAKEFEQLRVPGYDNFAKVPVPQEARDQILAHNILDTKGRDLLDFAQKHVGSLDLSTIAQGKVKAHEMTSFLNSSMGAGAMTQDRREYMEAQLAQDPTKFLNEFRGDNSKLREVLSSNMMRKSTLEQSLGLHPTNAPQPISGPSSGPKEGQTGVQKSTNKPIVFKNGAWRLQ